jgi:ribonuclease Z
MALLQDSAGQAARAKLRQLMLDIVDYHSTPEQAAQVARDAGVRYLLLNHIAPPLPLSGLEKAFLGDAASIFSGPLRVGADGDFISLPVGSHEVSAGRRF